MAKYFGRVGYAFSMESEPGVYIDQIVERNYFGDVLRMNSKWESSSELNDNLNINNEISIVADAFAFTNFSQIKYVEFMGALWKVTSIRVERPRLILTVGGVYNGEQA